MDRDFEYDAQLLDSNNSSLSPKQSGTKWPRIRKFMLFLISLVLIFCVGIEMVAFKSTATAFPFSACFVICLFLMCHSLSCFIICVYRIYVVSSYAPSIFTRFPLRQYLPMAIFRGVSISVIFIAISRDIPGSLLIIILQTATPLSIVMSRCVSSISMHSISRGHWTAILLTFVALTFGFIASFLGNLGKHYIDYRNEEREKVNAWWYTAICIAAMLPHALSILYGEIKLSSYAQRYPPELIHAFLSLLQCFVTFLLSPIFIYLGDPETLFWSDWYSFLHHAFRCLFDSDTDIDMYCPNGQKQSILQFAVWLLMSVAVQILTNYVLTATTPFIQRFCVLIGLLFAFVCFQMGFPSILVVAAADTFDECLLLGVLCSFVGSAMLLMDFNPTRSNAVLDSIQFDELNALESKHKHIQSELLSLKQQHESLSMSQQEINININETGGTGTATTQIYTKNRSKSLQQIYFEPTTEDTECTATDYVSYLLMQQQKQMIEEQYESKLAQYKRAHHCNQQRSHSAMLGHKPIEIVASFMQKDGKRIKAQLHDRKRRKKRRNKAILRTQKSSLNPFFFLLFYLLFIIFIYISLQIWRFCVH